MEIKHLSPEDRARILGCLALYYDDASMMFFAADQPNDNASRSMASRFGSPGLPRGTNRGGRTLTAIGKAPTRLTRA